MTVEFFDAFNLWYGHHEVAPAESDEILHMPFLVWAPYPAEMLREMVMALKTKESIGQFTVSPPADGDDGNLGVVVADPDRDAPEKLESPFMILLEGFRTFTEKSADKERIRIRQRHNEKRYFCLLTV